MSITRDPIGRRRVGECVSGGESVLLMGDHQSVFFLMKLKGELLSTKQTERDAFCICLWRMQFTNL